MKNIIFILFFILLSTESSKFPCLRKSRVYSKIMRSKMYKIYNYMEDSTQQEIKKCNKLLKINNKKYINTTALILIEKGKSISVYDSIINIVSEAETNKIISQDDKDILIFIMLSFLELETQEKKMRPNKIFYSSIYFINRNIFIPFIIHENTIHVLEALKNYFNIS